MLAKRIIKRVPMAFKGGSGINIQRRTKLFGQLFDRQIFRHELIVFILEKVHKVAYKKLFGCFLSAVLFGEIQRTFYAAAGT